jgi:phosphoribosylglycinamide formyltransferase-1
MLARITVLISGRGSNLGALIDAVHAGAIEGAITHVISNRPEANGLAIAARDGIATSVVDHRAFATRDAFDAALAETIDRGEPDLIVLAGFMRILGTDFVRRYEGRMINIHPSLLPAYPGTDTHRRALADQVARHGCTVHFVTPDVDGGPIIAQADVPVLPGDDPETLAARVLEVEHRLLPAVVADFCAGRIVLDGDRVRRRNGQDAPSLDAGLARTSNEPGATAR